ncbi:Fn3-like domain-containing protein [Fusarium sp. LHS14.1]|nr:Fn3-like domain-containing protein [Fusarium sp. LHS14.1]
MHLLGLFGYTTLLEVVALVHSALGATSSTRAAPPGAESWDEALRKARSFVSGLTTAEKIGLVTEGYTQPSLPCVGAIGGIERLGFNGLCFSDGPAGYSRSDGVSVFPSGITVAETWDRDLMYKRGVALGEEFKAKGAHVHLGPSSGPLGRHALGGRNWESFGPDPYLAGAAMSASGAFIIDAISSNIADRTLHELYLWPFADAFKAGTACIMCSYNRVNGNYSCANSELMAILKEELAFSGYVVSDWYATHGTASHANTGLDIEMPGNVSALAGPSYFGDLLLSAVKDGQVPESRLDDMAERVLTPYFLLDQDDHYPTVDPASGASFSVYQYGLEARFIVILLGSEDTDLAARFNTSSSTKWCYQPQKKPR